MCWMATPRGPALKASAKALDIPPQVSLLDAL